MAWLSPQTLGSSSVLFWLQGSQSAIGISIGQWATGRVANIVTWSVWIAFTQPNLMLAAL